MEFKCQTCGVVKDLPVTAEQFQRWKGGERIQCVLPELSADDRELMMSRTCGTCFDELFKDDEEEDDEQQSDFDRYGRFR